MDPAQFPIPTPVISPASPENGLALLGQNAILPFLVENPMNESLGLGNLIPKQSPNIYKFTQSSLLNDSVQQVQHFPFNGHDDSGKKKALYTAGGSQNVYGNGQDGQNSVDSEPVDGESSPAKSRLPQTAAVQQQLTPLAVPMWSSDVAPPVIPTVPAAAVGQTSLRPIGFEARWRYSSKARTGVPTNPSYTGWNSESYTAPSNSSTVTPVGQKRKSSRFLPSPDHSPENDYVGQHLQGIGGHYMDSWPKRKKKN